MIKLYIGNERSVLRRDILLILPTPKDPAGKSSIHLADGRVLKSNIAVATLKKRLDDYERIS